MSDRSHPEHDSHPARLGVGLTLLLALLVLPLLWRDYDQRLDAAGSQAAAHATGIARSLSMQLRNLDRALGGFVGDALQLQRRTPDALPAVLPTMAAEIAARHAEVDGVVVVAADGRALTPGEDEPELARWYASATPGSSELRVGPLRRGRDGEWLLPMARPLPELGEAWRGGFVVTRLRLSALQPLVADLPLGETGVASVMAIDGALLARSNDAVALGEVRFEARCLHTRMQDAKRGLLDTVSPIDGVRRLCAFQVLDDYPLAAVVGLGRHETLAPWYAFVALTLLGAGLYSLAWGLVLRRARRTAEHRAQLLLQLNEAERQYRFVFERNPLAGWLVARETQQLLGVNEAALRQYGYDREQFLALRPDDLQADMPQRPLPEGRSGPWRHRHRDGHDIRVMLHVADLDFGGRPARLMLADDVSERERLKAQAAFLASHDELTRLPNRTAFLATLATDLDVAAQRGQRMALAVFDFSQFQLINDNLGHAIGDAVLRRVGERLQMLAAGRAAVARLGGDEFALCLDLDRDGDYSAALSALRATLATPVEAMGTLNYLTPNIGIARFPEHAERADLLVKRASTAMHEAKRRAGISVREFEAPLEQRSGNRLEMVGRLHTAIHNQEFELFFQPQCRVDDERPVGVEALLRWRDPERGLVPPAEFIELCESSGLIVPIGRWVLQEACRQYQRLAADGWGDLVVAVNVSALQFATPGYVAEVAACLREHELPEGAIELELTESLVMDNPQQTIERMTELRELGLRLSIDDFGTGYSSMAYLRRLPVHKLKIDRAFVTQVQDDPQNAAICRSMLALARSFGLITIAEGVETDAELAWLRSNDCDEVQGYLMARPMPFEALRVWLHGRDRAAG
ncbi:MAG TPA: EAL domain-containing protein [Arenimonas sp.]|nr:EAL domain-containing protein [Arenimonas sp.]